MFPFPRTHPLNVAVYSNTFGLRNNFSAFTIEISDFIRNLIIYRVSKIYLIDSSKSENIRIIRKLIKYSLKPPYLKKYVGKDRDLTKSGLLYPINIPYHTVSTDKVEGEIRKIERGDTGIEGCTCSDGVALMINSEECKMTRYISIFYDGPVLEIISERDINNMENVIVSSRSGLNPLENSSFLKSLYQKKGITLLIGPPEGGVKRKFQNLPAFNFITKQGTSNVRSKEALFSALSILNSVLG